jgi:hypothetical protein
MLQYSHSYKTPLTKVHPYYQARFQMYWDNKVHDKSPPSHPSYKTPLTKVHTSYKTPLTKVHPSYKTPLTNVHPSYKTTFFITEGVAQ